MKYKFSGLIRDLNFQVERVRFKTGRVQFSNKTKVVQRNKNIERFLREFGVQIISQKKEHISQRLWLEFRGCFSNTTKCNNQKGAKSGCQMLSGVGNMSSGCVKSNLEISWDQMRIKVDNQIGMGRGLTLWMTFIFPSVDAASTHRYLEWILINRWALKWILANSPNFSLRIRGLF